METRKKSASSNAAAQFECECCRDVEALSFEHRIPRRDFLKTVGGVVIGAGAVAAGLPIGRVWAEPKNVDAATRAASADAAAAKAAASGAPESLVKTLFETLTPGQRETICFPWDHQDPKLGLLRTRVSANWNITDHFIVDDFYTDDQRAIVRGIFEGIINPEWHKRIDQQLYDDAGGYGEQNSIAIFGQPGSDQFEFVMTGRHMTIRCDGNTGQHVAFGGPIFYGHAADGFNEGPTHPGNVFWPQAEAANKLFEMLDGKQQEQALLRTGLPPESHVGFRGKDGPFQGISVRDLSGDQRDHLQDVVNMLVEPYRQGDRDEALACLKAQGGLETCHLAYYAQQDIGNDHVWDIWRLEGPSFVWHYRGAPHVHVWVNVADDPSVKLNA
jgi:hypothetical protein